MSKGREHGDALHWEAVEEASELVRERRLAEALLELRAVLGRDPKNPYAYALLGGALHLAGELEPARDAYRAALRLAPAHLGARVALSHVLRRLGDLEGAAREARGVVRDHPKDADALRALGLAQAQLGERAAARGSLQRYRAAAPGLAADEEVRAILASLGLDDAGAAPDE